MLRIAELVSLTAERIAQQQGKIRVRRRDNGKVTFVSPETVKKNPQLYEAPKGPGGLKSKKQERREKAIQEQKKRDKKKYKRDILKGPETETIRRFLDEEGLIEREEPKEKPRKKGLTPKQIKNAPRPEKGKCPPGKKPKKIVDKGSGVSFVICV